MICDNCKNNYATKKCITSINDKTEVLYLCNECYAELYNNSYNDEANFFTNIFNNAF